jgi:hypothetical protein
VDLSHILKHAKSLFLFSYFALIFSILYFLLWYKSYRLMPVFDLVTLQKLGNYIYLTLRVTGDALSTIN